MAMKLLIFKSLILTALVSATVWPVAAEDLDTALEAQKQKSSRRVYSEKARLTDHNLTVPRTETEEERQLDKKLRDMEAKLDVRPALTGTPQENRPVTVVPRPAEDKNWLTAAVLDDLESSSITNDTDDTWLARELTRQKEVKEQGSLDREKALVDTLMREKTSIQPISPEVDRLKQYQLSPPKIFGSRDPDFNKPAYMTPNSGIPDPLAAARRTPKNNAAEPALFSPAAARIAAAADKDPLSATRPTSFNLNPGVPVRKSSSVFSYGQKDTEPAPQILTPLEMIRKSSPINRPNPFADDHMPSFKGSIWE